LAFGHQVDGDNILAKRFWGDHGQNFVAPILEVNSRDYQEELITTIFSLQFS
jgi:hypothetical protein